MNELKHFRFDPLVGLGLFTLWVIGVFFPAWLPMLAPYHLWGIIGVSILIPFMMMTWLTMRFTRVDYHTQWIHLGFWRLLVSSPHFRKRAWVWLIYALILNLSTGWIAFNAVHWSWLIVVVAIELLGLVLLLLEAEVFLAHNYYLLEYAAAIAIILNLLTVLAAIAAIFFLNQWQLPTLVIGGLATAIITLLGSAYALVYIEQHNYLIPIVLAITYGILWYYGLHSWFINFPWLWLAPAVLYGYLLNVLDILLYREHKLRNIFQVTVIFLLTGVVLLR